MYRSGWQDRFQARLVLFWVSRMFLPQLAVSCSYYGWASKVPGCSIQGFLSQSLSDSDAQRDCFMLVLDNPGWIQRKGQSTTAAASVCVEAAAVSNAINDVRLCLSHEFPKLSLMGCTVSDQARLA